MGDVVSRSCPNCGAPVPTQNTLLTCEFCKAPLMVVKPQAPPPMEPAVSVAPTGGVPVAPFGGVPLGGVHAPRRSGGAAAVLVLVAVLLVIGTSMAILFISMPSHKPPVPEISPPPTVAVPQDPDPTGIAGPGKVTGDGLIAMFDTQCAQGDAQSCITAGTLYEHGQMGVAVDRAKARSYYQRACNLGNAAGCSMAKRL